MLIETDFLVIGSGIAGLTYAIKVAEHFPNKKIIILTKADKDESNTKYAQGGIAVVNDFLNDSFKKHIEDTLNAGDGLCNKKIVKIVIKEGPERLQEIINWGVKFDKENAGKLRLNKEGGHSANRIIHHKDITGFEIEKTLVKYIKKLQNIKFHTHYFAFELLTQNYQTKDKINYSEIACHGAYVLDLINGGKKNFLSKTTFLATGGIGQVYKITTNPVIATGDGIAMAYRAGAVIENMEFVQFHPTALYDPDKTPAFLISEAVRGASATLRTIDEKKFMYKYNSKKELATRDIVTRAIYSEMKSGKSRYVLLDCRHISKNIFIRKFPNIYQKCLSIGINTMKNMIPVIPAAHYLCGGIKTDEYGRTNIKNLYACGECASTGLHGANRLASNSLLEALVFSHRCYLDVIRKNNLIDLNIDKLILKHETESINNKIPPDTTNMLKKLQYTMTKYAGVIRMDKEMRRALKILDVLYKETECLHKYFRLSDRICELKNMITVSILIVKSAINRTENKGLHYNIDLENNT